MQPRVAGVRWLLASKQASLQPLCHLYHLYHLLQIAAIWMLNHPSPPSPPRSLAPLTTICRAAYVGASSSGRVGNSLGNRRPEIGILCNRCLCVCVRAVDRKKRRQKTKKRGRGGMEYFVVVGAEEVGSWKKKKKEEEEDARRRRREIKGKN